MTVLGLRADFSKFGTYFVHKLSSLRYCALMQLILGILSYPLAFSTMIAFMEASEAADKARKVFLQSELSTDEMLWQAACDREDTLETLFVLAVFIGCLALLGIVIMNLVTISNSYRWLIYKNYVDMDYSLPVSSDTRFWGDFLAGLTVTTIPHVLSVLVGRIILCAPIINRMVYASNIDIDNMPDFGSYLASMMWTGVIACIMFYCVSLLIVACVGKRGASGVLPILVGIALPVIHISAMTLSLVCAYGYEIYDISDFISVAATSPLGLVIGAIISFVSVVGHFDNIVDYTPVIFNPAIIIPVVLITVVAAVGAYLIVKLRRAERVGSAYVFKAAQYVFEGIVILAIVLVFAIFFLNSYINDRNTMITVVVSAVFATLVAHIAMELTAKASLKGLLFVLMRYVLYMAGSVAISFALICSNGFGIGMKAPSVNNCVEVSLGVESGEAFYRDGNVWFTEEENIRLVAQLHDEIEKELPDLNGRIEYLEHDWYAYDKTYYISIEYKFNDGQTKLYRYSLSKDEYERLVRAIVVPEAVGKHYDALISEYMGVDFDPVTDMTKKNISAVSVTNSEKDYIPVNGLKATELYDAIELDCQKVNYELLHEGKTGYYDLEIWVEMEYNGAKRAVQITVYPWFENTLALLEKHGVSLKFEPDPADYNTAFLIKMNGMDKADVYGSYTMAYSMVDPMVYMSIADMFGMVGAPEFAEYARVNQLYDGYFTGEQAYTEEVYYDENDEIVYIKEGTDEYVLTSDPYESVRKQHQHATVKKLDVNGEEVKTLLSDTTGVYTADDDLTKDHYILLLTDMESADILEAESHYEEYVILYVMPESSSVAESIINAA